MSDNIPRGALLLLGSIWVITALLLLPRTVVTPAHATLSDYQRIISLPKPTPADILSGTQDLPVLVNTGIESCPPCHLMASSLLELHRDYGHVFLTFYYDIKKEPGALATFLIRTVPTQIFYSAEGEELHRNEGFLSKAHLLDIWRDIGLDIAPPPGSQTFLERMTLDNLLSSLTLAIHDTPISAMLAAFAWGVLSIVLSPCHLVGVPLIIGYVNGQKVETAGRSITLALLFGIGILLSILVIGVVTAMAGRLLGDLGPLPYYLVSGVFILFGLGLIGLVPMGCLVPERFLFGSIQKKGAVALGLILGIGLGPCTFMYMAPILGLTLALSTTDLLYGIMLFGLFAVGHCLLLILAAMSPRLIQFLLRWNERSLSSSALKKVCGALLILGGVYLAYSA